ncbi:DUF4430 domain-containing protein [Sporosarcina sp. NPDC096371]|uniref:DUF4430 domain-containing protein n=1 Tax=Sporosarcina sp. NPDC096371 TaxID=3364530 RepID=UPI00381B5396
MGILQNQLKKYFSILLSLLLAVSLFTPTVGAIALDARQGVSAESFGGNSTEQSLDVKNQLESTDNLDSEPLKKEQLLGEAQGSEEGNLSFSEANPSKFAVFEDNSIQVSVRIEGLGETIIPPMEFDVEAYDISHATGETASSATQGPRAIHAIVKALELSGFDVSDKTKFDFGGGNFITNVDGLKMNAINPSLDGWMYFVNNEYANVGVGDFQLKENDSITLYFVTNYFTNTFTWFDKELVEVHAGEEIQFELMGDNYGSTQPIDNAVILVNDAPLEIDGQEIETDAQGIASLRFDTPGEYHISAQRLDGQYSNITRPYSKVIVLEEGEKEPSPTPRLSVDSIVEAGTINPAVTVLVIDDTFSANVTDKANWAIQENTTGLEIDTITSESNQKVTISFNGKAQEGTFAITALAGALDGSDASETNLVEVLKGENVPEETQLDKMIEDTVQYYKSGSKNVSSWWQLVALWGAGENLTDGSWSLPSWQTTDPKLKEDTFDTEHIRYIFGLLAMGKDPSKAWETNRNLYAELAAQQKADGSIGGMNKHVWAMLALDAGEKLGQDVGKWNKDKKQQAVKYVLDSQKSDGGFALFGSISDTDITGMVLLALGNYQGDSAVDAAIERAKKYLKERQLDLTNGGFNSPGNFGMGDNSNSLSTSVSGLVAVGEDMLAEKWIVNGKTVVDAYKDFQMENGGFKWKHNDKNVNGMATEQALVALADIQKGKSVWQRIAEPNLEEKPDSDTAVQSAIRSVSELMLQKGVLSEWGAIGLARAGVEIPASYTDLFLANLNSQVIDKVGSGRLKITDVERLTIAAAAVGIDARNANGQGFSLIEKIHTSEHWTWENTDSILYQGNNGIIFALIALDSKGFEVPENAKWTRDKLVAELLKYQKTDGSWSLSASTTGTSSVDITAMALIALAPYQDKTNAKTAIDKAVAYLSTAQGPTGGFNEAFVGGISSEATSQVIIGLTANNIDPRGEQFTKNGIHLIDHLLSFKAEDGGFKHTVADKTSNGMANEQALQALVAFDLFEKGEGRLYDFGKEVQTEPDTVVVSVKPDTPFVFDNDSQPDVSKPVVLDFQQFDKLVLPEITVERGDTTLNIPGDTQVEGVWDKKIQAPTYQETNNSDKEKVNSKLDGKKVSTIDAHIKVGGAKQINFNQHVTLTFKDIGEHEAGFIDTAGNFELIKKYPKADAARGAVEDVYAYNDGADLIIKTKHFTEFLAFETTAIEPGNPGSGGGGGGTLPTIESVTLSVEKRTMDQGDIIGSMDATLQRGDTAFTLLERVVREKGISIDYIGSGATLYVQAIDGLGEFDGGPLSGWMYSVNGVYPDHSAGTYYLNDGDVLRWRYTKDLGHDIGGGYVSGEEQDKDKDNNNNNQEQTIPDESITGATKWMKANRDFSNYDHFIDWDVLGLARSNQAVPSAYYHAFEKYVKEQKGSFRKVTDYERMVLAVTAIGKDPKNIAGYDFIEKIYNNERMTAQGTNGVIFALLALDSNNYEVPKNASWTREKLLKWLLEQQNSDGGFPLAEGATSDVDMTAMALQALANYQKTQEVKTATNKALEWLSKQQRVEGGFQSAGSVNSESISQVIIALSSLGIDLSDKRFKKGKGDLRTALLAFVNKDGGISHTKGSESNYMATQQGLLAFIANNRLKNGENRLYDMTDVSGKKPTIAFLDVTKQTFGYEEISRLVAEGVISGYPDGTFKPNEHLNRGQAAILFAKALRLNTAGSPIGFKDIAKSSSFFKAANATKAAGIFMGKGNGTTFGATDILTREQMASVLVRAFDLKSTNEEVNIADMNHISASHRKDVEILYQNKITMGTTSGKFDPKSSVSRAQFAVFLSRAMDNGVKK